MATLTGQFYTLKGKRVQITITSDTIPSAGTLQLGKDPLHLVMSAPDDKYPGVRTFECEISILTRESLAFLYSDDPLHTKVEVTLDTRKIFAGYLMPSEWAQPMTPGEWNECSVVAVDALAALKNVFWDQRTLMRGTPDTYGTPSLVGLIKEHCGNNITVSYQTGLDGILDGYFSTEAFMGTDLTDPDAHTSLGEMLQDYARAMGVTLTMITDTLYVYRGDDEGTLSGTLTLSGTDLDMEMIPPVRRVSGEWSAIPDVEKPVVKGSTSTVFTYDTDDDEKLNAPHSAANDWEAVEWPSKFSGWKGTKPSLFGTAAKEHRSSDMFPGINSRQKPEACHIYVPYSASFSSGVMSMTYSVHNNHDRDDDYEKTRMAMLPDDATCGTIRENAVGGSLKLQIGSTEVKCSYIDNVYGLDSSVTYNERLELFEDSAWGKARIQFRVGDHNEALIRARGRIQMWVYSWWGTRPSFVKDITIESASNDPVKLTENANGSIAFDDKDFGSALCSSHTGNSIGTIGTSSLTHYAATHYALQRIAAQYASVHTQWTGKFDDAYLSQSLASVTRHVTFQSKKHTIMAFDWDLRNAETEITILEDYKQ